MVLMRRAWSAAALLIATLAVTARSAAAQQHTADCRPDDLPCLERVAAALDSSITIQSQLWTRNLRDRNARQRFAASQAAWVRARDADAAFAEHAPMNGGGRAASLRERIRANQARLAQFADWFS